MGRLVMRIIIGCFVFAIGVPLCISLFGFNKSKVEQSIGCAPASGATVETVAAPAGNVSLSPTGLTVKGSPMTSSQAAIAAHIAGIVVARSDSFPGALQHRAIVIAYITAIVESDIQNLTYGDRDSLGVFQQRPSEGWGTPAQVTNVTYATNSFLNHLLHVPGWQSMPMGDAAQAVQHSGNPGRYAEYVDEGEAIYSYLSFDGKGSTDGSSTTAAYAGDDTEVADICATQSEMASKISAALNAALSQVGTGYTWGIPPDGASFVSWAYGQAGITMPSNIHDLATWTGDASANLTTTWIPAAQIKSGETSVQAGDIVFWSDGRKNPTRDTVTRAGLALGATDTSSTAGGDASIKVATYNLKGASHTAKTGPQSGAARAKQAAQLIAENGFAVVGLQEVQASQRKQVLASLHALGKHYSIYPDPANYGPHQQPWSDNSIIWDTSQVSLVSDGSLKMPYYFHHAREDIPLAGFKQLATGKQFLVADTHDPAYNRYAKLRYEDALQHAADADRLTSTTGLPLFFTGDFNSSYTVQPKKNPTYQSKRANLTWCVMTSSGTMRDGYDAFRGRSGPCPSQTEKELGAGRIDHVFVSNDVAVSGYHEITHDTASDHSVVYIDAVLENGAATSDSSNQYVGPNPRKGNKIDVMSIKGQQLAGVLRPSMTSPSTTSIETGQSFVGNDGFGGGNCVEYVKYILARHSSRYHGQVDLTTGAQGIAAYTVAQNLGTELGYTVNHTPAVHATVSFGTAYANPTLGHVALVAQINQDGSIVVEEANWHNYNAYGTHTVPASEVPYLTYAHTEVGWH